MDTIFALSTPPGRGGVSVVRLSGPEIARVCDRFGLGNLSSRYAHLRVLRDGDDVLDEAIVIRFDKDGSFTGEEVLELQLHGSPAVRDAVLGRLGDIKGLRHAEPGEFTRRALENGRMDIAEVEGLAALIDAETDAQRRQAQRVFSGALGDLAEGWRTDLIKALALLEVTIDFADEEVPVDVRPDVEQIISKTLSELETEISGSRFAERVRDGFEVAIVGAPNAGKSTLLNALAGRRAALTSEIAGTTRDVIEVRMDLEGLPVTFLDTAGLRVADDEVEKMGVALAAERANAADLRIFLKSDNVLPDIVVLEGNDIQIWGKGDQRTGGERSVSGRTGAGLDALVGDVTTILRARAARVGVATHARHREAIGEAAEALENALSEIAQGEDRTELAAEEIRRGLVGLDLLVGRFDVEYVLDEIFSRFCLGK